MAPKSNYHLLRTAPHLSPVVPHFARLTLSMCSQACPQDRFGNCKGGHASDLLQQYVSAELDHLQVFCLQPVFTQHTGQPASLCHGHLIKCSLKCSVPSLYPLQYSSAVILWKNLVLFSSLWHFEIHTKRSPKLSI